MGNSATSGGGTGAARAADYIAVTDSGSYSPTSTDTTLTSELPSSGLSRAAGTYAHTTNASSYTISHTFTATATKTVTGAALFNASSSGTMSFASAVSPTATVSNGDQLTVTFTISM